jgi:hypothetical protein
MQALGVEDLPSDRIMDDVDKALQKLCGIQTIRYSGKLGHVYHVNDLAAIIAQVSNIPLFSSVFLNYITGNGQSNHTPKPSFFPGRHRPFTLSSMAG